jgi:uncharacterized membrane protein YqaE (UPF0057 family)
MFHTVSIEQLIFHLFMPMEGVKLEAGVAHNFVMDIILHSLLVVTVLFVGASIMVEPSPPP